MKHILLISCVASIWEIAATGHISNTWTRYRFLDGYRALSGTTKTTRSVVQCGTICNSLDMCQSYFYTTGELTSNCQLHDIVFVNNTGMEQTPNVTYYIPANYSIPTFDVHGNDDLYHSVVLADGSAFNYKFYNIYTNYKVAESLCANDNATLVRLTMPKLDLLRTILLSPDFEGNTIYTVGGMYDTTNSTYYFSGGSPANFPSQMWASFQPLKQNVNDCIGLGSSYSWYAATQKCTSTPLFICEKI